ncbi:unnamed protein product, partial [Sphenostylis stenocarpa]
LSLGDARAYFLSTAKNELGVVSAESIADPNIPTTLHSPMAHMGLLCSKHYNACITTPLL